MGHLGGATPAMNLAEVPSNLADAGEEPRPRDPVAPPRRVGSGASEAGGILRPVATYEYVCLACERRFEERRPMGAVETALACPSCGSDRVRRRFSFVAGPGTRSVPADGGCACGGSCACAG